MTITAQRAEKAIPIEEAKRLFEIRDGNLLRRVTTGRHGRWKAGSFAGSKNAAGYIQVNICGRLHLAHRVIFALTHGWEPEEVDHINGDRSDNRVENLRAATRSQNAQNTPLRRDNKSGVRGVYWSKTNNAWHVRVNAGGKMVFNRYFKDLDEAKAARELVARREHGEFLRGAQ